MSLPAVARLVRDFAKAMTRLRTGWYVFGAQAVVAYGRPRMTADVDITVDLGDHSVDELVAALKKAGFVFRVRPTAEFLEQARVLPLMHSPTELPTDVVLAGPGLELEFLERARPVDLGGASVPVITVEDLVVTKLLAGRSKDLEDIRGILDERGTTMDLARVREVVDALEDALDQSDLSPVLERLLGEAKLVCRSLPKKRARPRRRRP